VAALSPSTGLPSRFRQVHELGMRNLEKNLGLIVEEYPLARLMMAGFSQLDSLPRPFADHITELVNCKSSLP
jgi:hypothetical protein